MTDMDTKEATVRLDGHPGVEYAVTIVDNFDGTWGLKRVTATAIAGTLTDWNIQRPSAGRLIHNVLHGRDLLAARDDSEPRREFDCLPAFLAGALCRAGITTMATVAEMTDEDILALPWVGPTYLAVIREKVELWRAQVVQVDRESTPAVAPQME
ncbi:hypothetical protein [Nocardia brasiliensis]|uniref:hypothetical protein n=1 Tax=Nocardia brasiliensis TaxID=37326 RepID=UPI00245752D5|nr:hypothetical protein [Nocardia brasiliensis]